MCYKKPRETNYILTRHCVAQSHQRLANTTTKITECTWFISVFNLHMLFRLSVCVKLKRATLLSHACFWVVSNCESTPSLFPLIKHITTSCATFFVPLYNNSSSCVVENLLVISAFAEIVCGYSGSNLSILSSFLYMYLIRRRLLSVISFNLF